MRDGKYVYGYESNFYIFILEISGRNKGRTKKPVGVVPKSEAIGTIEKTLESLGMYIIS